MLEWILGK